MKVPFFGWLNVYLDLLDVVANASFSGAKPVPSSAVIYAHGGWGKGGGGSRSIKVMVFPSPDFKQGGEIKRENVGVL